MIVITGALGFIGSYLVGYLNEKGIRDIVVVDDFYKDHKEPNLEGKLIREWVHRDIFIKWFAKSHYNIDLVFHLGARTDTTSSDQEIFDRLNLDYSKALWNICAEHGIDFIYASSAATYGDGANGYSDTTSIDELAPLNAYAVSKHAFDLWALEQTHTPPRWAGLKFFNVYGPNEYHKGRMASVVMHAYNQIKSSGRMQLFRSHRSEIKDGEQSRDFIYVKDVASVCCFLKDHPFGNGLYNLGTGQARTFLDLVHATFAAMNVEPDIEFIDTPADIRETYQYFTEAEMQKLQSVGYTDNFTKLEDGVRDYVQNYLVPRKRY